MLFSSWILPLLLEFAPFFRSIAFLTKKKLTEFSVVIWKKKERMSERKWTNDSKSQAKKRLGNNVGSHNPRAHIVVCTHWREQKLCFILVAISCWYFFFSCCCRPINYLMFGAGLYILCAYICDFRIDFVAMLLSIVFHSDYAWMDWVMSEANILVASLISLSKSTRDKSPQSAAPSGRKNAR